MMNLLTQNRNFRLLFSARLITNIGDSVYFIAAMWLVYQLSGSSFFSGLAGFLTMIPRTLQFLIGPILDRYSIKKLLVGTQLAQACLLAIIPAAALIGNLSVTLILIIMPVVSFLNQFSFPAESALIPQIMKKEQWIQANGLMTLAYQGTDAAFQAIGGALVALLGAVSMYHADILSFGFAVVLFTMLKLPEHPQSSTKQTVADQCKQYLLDLREGFRTVIHSIIGKMMVGSLMTNFALGALVAVLPAYSDHLGGPGMYGLMMAGMAVGTLIGALVARCFKNKPVGKMLVFGYSIGFLLWLAAALVPNPMLSFILFSVSLVFPGCNNVLNFTLIQNVVPQHLLARAMSLVASLATCIMPLGSLVGGSLSDLFGSPIIFAASSIGFFLYAAYVALMPSLRRLPAAATVKPEDFGFTARTEAIHEQSHA
ncbi:MFS transporter [Sporolactobacillus inulinus]|jgi:MFS family permease|nr:MFS transporter [Sporolactobacillus inulinus]